jgi:hypothetical protein
MPQSNASKTRPFGSSEIPTLLEYPEIPLLSDVPELDGRLVYIIKGYPLEGHSVLMWRTPGGELAIRAGDFNGKIIDPRKLDEKIAGYLMPLSELMITARIPQAQFYFSGHTLVDIRKSLDNMTGPGMLKDLCSKIVPTQEIIDIKPLDDDLKESLNQYDYVILKHSSFKVIVRGDVMLPMYGIFRGQNERQP